MPPTADDRAARRRLRGVPLLACVLAAFGPTPARTAEPTPVLERNWFLSAGSYLTEFATDASVGGGGLIGTFFRAEDELGIDADQAIFRFEGLYRFNRNAIEAGYWEVNRDGNRSLTKQIEFDGVLYDIGAAITSQADVSYVRLGWRYSAVRSERGEAGFAAGLSTFSFDVAMQGEGTIDDGMGGTITGDIRAEESFVAPAPTVGIFVNFAAHPRVVIRAKVDYLDAQVDTYEANLSETLFGVDWYFVRNVALGVGTLTTRIEYKDTGEDSLLVNYRQSGLVAHVSASF